VIRRLDRPINSEGALAVWRGNPAPVAACPDALRGGSALRFDNHASLDANIDRDDLEAAADTEPAPRHAGSAGNGWRSRSRRGCRDKGRATSRPLRARMSSAAYRAWIVHVGPESCIAQSLAGAPPNVAASSHGRNIRAQAAPGWA